MLEYAKPKQKETSKDTVQRQEPQPVVRPNTTGIPDTMKTRYEGLSGFSLDDVKIHYNSDKPKKLNALAFTQGSDVHIAPGQEKHLSHELGHVVQQKQGRVRPTISVGGMPVNDDPVLEKEADSGVVQMFTNNYIMKNMVIQKCGGELWGDDATEAIEDFLIESNVDYSLDDDEAVSDDEDYISTYKKFRSTMYGGFKKSLYDAFRANNIAGVCWICQEDFNQYDSKLKFSIDHVMSVKKHYNALGKHMDFNGRNAWYNDAGNWRPAHISCNAARGG